MAAQQASEPEARTMRYVSGLLFVSARRWKALDGLNSARCRSPLFGSSASFSEKRSLFLSIEKDGKPFHKRPLGSRIAVRSKSFAEIQSVFKETVAKTGANLTPISKPVTLR